MKKTLLALMAICISTTAFANMFSFSNFYVDGFGGVNFVNSYEKEGARIDLNPGYIAGGALGYRFSRFFRIEGEGAYRSNSFNQLVLHEQKFPASGEIRKATAMGNGIIDLCFWDSGLVPYVGVGIGERWDQESFTLKPVVIGGVPTVFTAKDTSRDLAYQGIVGVNFCSYKNLHLGVEYRYLDGPDIQANNSLDFSVKAHF